MGQIRIVHVLPGRVRLGVKLLKRNKSLQTYIGDFLLNQKAVKSYSINDLTGSVLIYYYPQKTKLTEIVSGVQKQILCFYSAASKEAAVATELKHLPVWSAKKGDVAKKAIEPSELPIPVQIAQLTISGLVLLVQTIKHFMGNTPLEHSNKLLNITSITTLVSAYPIMRSGILGTLEEKRLNNDLLISAATLVALLMGEGITALVVVWLVNLSELFQAYTLDRSRKAISDLLQTKNEQAWLVVDGTQVSVPVDSLKPEDVVVVHQGGKIPVDGKITEGTAAVNQSAITGESIPVYKKEGDFVYAGTVVEQGSIHILAEKVGDNTALARIIHMVEEASSKRAPIQNIADKYSYKIVPLSFLMASIAFLLTRDIRRTMTILIVACPCAAGLATPTAISAAIGNAARRGILIKGGCYLEAAGNVDTVLFDKTGTLTEGKPEVSTYISFDDKYPPEKVLSLAAAGEMHTNHPLAMAVVSKAQEVNGEILPYHDKEMIIGMGLKAKVENNVVLIGNHSLMQKEQVNYDKANNVVEELSKRGESIIYVALKERLIGIIGVRDTLRKQSKKAIRQLMATGVENIGLVSGDNKESALAVGSELDVTNVWANMLPEDKVRVVQCMQKRGKTVAMVGEGINDSPALAVADIGIAMGVKGTDVAVESADIVLAGDDPLKVAELIKLSQQTMRVINQNFAFAIGANALGMALGTLQIISPLTAAVLHNASTLAVVLNSARLMNVKES